jgi:predicted metal-dependent hydrolase
VIQKLEQKLHYGKAVIEYYIVKTKRRKTSEIIVDKDTIEVRAPRNKPDHEIQKIVQNKATWILKKQKEYREMNSQISRPTFKENSTLPYLGKNYPLRILYRQAKNSIRFDAGQFKIILLSSSGSSTSIVIEKLYEEWLMKIARPIFKNKIESFSGKLSVSKPETIAIKKLKKRWASIGKDGDTINLNANLYKTPEDIIDYIIIHELCHLKIKGHSHHFWDLLHKFMPNYQEKIDWLKINARNLI